MTTNSFNNQNHGREFYLLPDLTQLNIVQGVWDEVGPYRKPLRHTHQAVPIESQHDSSESRETPTEPEDQHEANLPSDPKPPESLDDCSLRLTYSESYSLPPGG